MPSPTRTRDNLYDWFEASADRYPEHTALEIAGHTLTYARLRAAAEWMSARIHDAAGGLPTRVGLLTSRHIVSYVGYLAVQRLGATAVPLNPAAPAMRNADITTEAELDLTIISDASGDGLAEYRQKADVPLLDMTGQNWAGLLAPDPAEAPPERPRRTGEDTAYIIFTSGTTGRPKGVPTVNRSLNAFLDHVIPRYELGPGCRVSQTFELSFDGSVIEMFSTWGSGSTLCPAQQAEVFTPVKFVNDKRLTHWMSVPSIISFAKRLRALAPDSMPSLRRGMFGGEALTIEQAEAWTAAAPNAKVHNCYGPTETTIIITGYAVPEARADWPETSNRSVPIGHPYPHLEWVLLDDDLRPADDGELCVRGPQRFPGYLVESDNAGRFVLLDGPQGRFYDGSGPLTDEHYYRTGDRCRLEHGELVHLGRIDGQIKIRGNRVELGEIESTLRRHPAIAEVVVLTVTADDGETDLHALHTGGVVTSAEFSELLAQLPRYMRPKGFHHRDSIPLTTVGKVDRKRLAEELAAELG